VPHARTVGIESDREYGLAVLRALVREMNAGPGRSKSAGVSSLAGLRTARPDTVLPRLVVVIERVQVLLAGATIRSPPRGRRLEDLARKGRSYGIHLILASQTIAGSRPCTPRKTPSSASSRWHRPARRVGDPGHRHTAADALPVGTAVVTPPAGSPKPTGWCGSRTPDPPLVPAQRHLLWHARPAVNDPPAVVRRLRRTPHRRTTRCTPR